MSASTPSGKVSKAGKHDPAHDVLHSERHPLEAIFKPRSVAVIGATERPGSIGPNGLQEKDLVLDVALRLGRDIDHALPYEERLLRAANFGEPYILGARRWFAPWANGLRRLASEIEGVNGAPARKALPTMTALDLGEEKS